MAGTKKGSNKKVAKQGTVRRRRSRSKSRTHKKKNAGMKGGASADGDETAWTAKQANDGTEWTVSKGTEVDKIYMLENTKLHRLSQAQETLLNDSIIGKISYKSGSTTPATRTSLSEIENGDTWDGANTSNAVPGYASVVASAKAAGSDAGLGQITLTFAGGAAGVAFPNAGVTFVLLTVN